VDRGCSPTAQSVQVGDCARQQTRSHRLGRSSPRGRNVSFAHGSIPAQQAALFALRKGPNCDYLATDRACSSKRCRGCDRAPSCPSRRQRSHPRDPEMQSHSHTDHFTSAARSSPLAAPLAALAAVMLFLWVALRHSIALDVSSRCGPQRLTSASEAAPSAACNPRIAIPARRRGKRSVAPEPSFASTCSEQELQTA
jgi:hypothetical protein